MVASSSPRVPPACSERYSGEGRGDTAAAFGHKQGVTGRCLLLASLLIAGCSLERPAANESASKAVPPAAEPSRLPAPDVGAIRVDGATLSGGRELTDWPATAFNYAQQRFSPLTALTPDTVRNLAVAWGAPLDGEQGAALAGPVATPIVAGEVLYATGAGGWLRAFDTRSGELLWRADPDAVDPPQPAPPVGAALWKGRVFVARAGGVLASYDAKTGRLLWHHAVAEKADRITSAPLVADNLVFVGIESGGRGAVVALDYSNGSERWRFWTVPAATGAPDRAASDGALAQVRATWGTGPAATLPGLAAPTAEGTPAARTIGGGAPETLAYDPVYDHLLVGTRQPVGDIADEGVASDKLFSRSLLALGTRTGEFAWHRHLPGAGALNQLLLAELATPAGRMGSALLLTGSADQAVVGLAEGALLGWRPYLSPLAEGPETMAGPAAPTVTPSLLAASYSPDMGLLLVPGLPAPVDAGADAPSLPALVALDPRSGAVRWSIVRSMAGGGVLTTAGGLVFQGSASGRLTAYTIDSGRPVWTMPASGPVTVAPSSFLVQGVQHIAVVIDGAAGRPARLVLLRGPAAATQQNP